MVDDNRSPVDNDGSVHKLTPSKLNDSFRNKINMYNRSSCHELRQSRSKDSRTRVSASTDKENDTTFTPSIKIVTIGQETIRLGLKKPSDSVGINGIPTDIVQGNDQPFELASSPSITNDVHCGDSKISELQAGWNVTNAIQGMALVSLPYSILHGGYWGIVALLGVAYVCCYTGKILVDCLYEKDKQTGKIIRVRGTYADIAQVCFGPRYGGKIIYTAQVIELIMTCILYVVLCGDLMVGIYPKGKLNVESWMIICSLSLIPCAFLKNLKAVSTLSLWNTIAHFAINAAILAYCGQHYEEWHYEDISMELDTRTFPVTLGIIVFSYTSQIFLPSLEGNMKEPSRFDHMLNWSHIAAAISKALFAYVGFLTFGHDTQEVITNNLPNGQFKIIVNFALVAKALLSYPLPYFAAAELLETGIFKRSSPRNSRPPTPPPLPRVSGYNHDQQVVDRIEQAEQARDQPNGTILNRLGSTIFRISLVLCTMIAAVSIPHFALLMGFIGSFTGTMLSFVWPCYFHIYLHWDHITAHGLVWNCTIIFLGVFLCISGMYSSFLELTEVIGIDNPNA